MRPYEPKEDRRIGITCKFDKKKWKKGMPQFLMTNHFIHFGYALEDGKMALRVIKIFGGGKIGTDYCAFMNVIDLNMTKILQFHRHPYDAIKDMADDEPRRSDKTPMTIQGYICDMILKDPEKFYVHSTEPRSA